MARNDKREGSKRRRSNNGGGNGNNAKPNNNGNGANSNNNSTPNYGWLSKYPELIQQAGKMPDFRPTGQVFKLHSNPKHAGKLLYKQSVSGVMGLGVMNAFGTSNDATSALNKVSQQLFGYIRYVNNGRTNYDHMDLMMYILGMDSVFSYHAFLCRLYGLANLYSPNNKYYPESLIEIQGVDFKDIISHLPDLRYFINTMAVNANRLCVPKNIELFNRHSSIYSGIYVDSETVNAQTYVMYPVGIHIYGEGPNGDKTGAGKLEYYKFNPKSKLLTFEELKTIGNNLLENLITSEDIGIMSGDIMKAYGLENCAAISTLPEDYVVIPTYDLDMLTQIENATVNGAAGMEEATIFDVTQDVSNGLLLYKPAIKNTLMDDVAVEVYAADRILNYHTTDVKPEMNVLATRFAHTCWTNPVHQGYQDITACGTEIIVSCKVAIYELDSIKGVMKLSYTTVPGLVTHVKDRSELAISLRELEMIQDFSYHPYASITGDIDNQNYTMRQFSLDKFLTVSTDELSRMHEAAAYAMFDVPRPTRS